MQEKLSGFKVSIEQVRSTIVLIDYCTLHYNVQCTTMMLQLEVGTVSKYSASHHKTRHSLCPTSRSVANSNVFIHVALSTSHAVSTAKARMMPVGDRQDASGSASAAALSAAGGSL